MKVLHLVGGDLSGGAARGAYWLHLGLLGQGVESRILTNGAPVGDPSVTSPEATRLGKFKLVLRMQLDRLPLRMFYRSREQQSFHPGYFGYNILKSPQYAWADIIHLHWVSGGTFDVHALKHCPKPVVWTMRDMWPMTGGCHYALDCTRYKTGCGRCPQLSSTFRYDLSYFLGRRKRKGLRGPFHAVAISQWLADCATESRVMGERKISVIPNAINTDTFFPVDKKKARELLGLPADKHIILFGHASGGAYKGVDLLFDALNQVQGRNLQVLNVEIGNRTNRTPEFDFISLGFLHDDVSLRLAYSAADVFIAASRAEAFGKMLIEAMACGTAVVAFDATGPKDIVVHQETGYLAKPFQTDDLANGIEWVLADRSRTDQLGTQARSRVEKYFSLSVVAEQYVDLYEKMLRTDNQ